MRLESTSCLSETGTGQARLFKVFKALTASSVLTVDNEEREPRVWKQEGDEPPGVTEHLELSGCNQAR